MSDPNATPYIHWNEEGDSIIIDDSQAVSTARGFPKSALHIRPPTHTLTLGFGLAQFSGNVLKQVFGHTKFSVFVRLMKCAGFTKLARKKLAKEG
jgi:hypothetical protein